MASLDDMAVKYGGTVKIDEVKELWKQGVSTELINEDLLLKYLHGDIDNTEIVFLAQVSRAREQGQLTDILERMDGLLATTEMEYNGLHVDQEQATIDQGMLEKELSTLSNTLEDALPRLPEGMSFNWGSNIHKSCLLFGGTIKYQRWAPHLDAAGFQIFAQMDELHASLIDGRTISLAAITAKYGEQEEWTENLKSKLQFFAGGKKKGELKTKQVKVNNPDKPKGAQKDFFFKFDAVTEADKDWKGKLTDGLDGPIYSTGKEIIAALGMRDIPFLKALANREKIAKDLGTYYMTEDDKGVKKGMLTCVMEDGKIHHKLNHTTTITSRLSSSDPNLQNIPRPDFDEMLGRAKSVVKRMFSSRFDGGYMAEIDYSQLEVVVQGLLTQDPTLIADIQSKIDFHCKRLSAKLHEEYDYVKGICKDEKHPEFRTYKLGRTKIKEFTFQRALNGRTGARKTH